MGAFALRQREYAIFVERKQHERGTAYHRLQSRLSLLESLASTGAFADVPNYSLDSGLAPEDKRHPSDFYVYDLSIEPDMLL